MNEPTRVLTVDANRLAALEQRVGALVEALLGCFGPDGADSYGDMATRLAALRAPGVGAKPRVGVPDQVEALETLLATARRERNEAVGICRRLVAGSGETLEGIIRDARALVAGQGVAHARDAEQVGEAADRGIDPYRANDALTRSVVRLRQELEQEKKDRWQLHDQVMIAQRDLAARDAEIAGLKREVDTLGDHVRAHFRDKERALDELSQARIEVETIQSKLAGAEHAIADLTTTFGTVESDRDTLRSRIAELEAREKGARWLLATAHITKSLTPPELHSKREAWLAGGHAAPIPDPARGLIERAAKVLETYVPLSEDELIADLRAYLGGGT